MIWRNKEAQKGKDRFPLIGKESRKYNKLALKGAPKKVSCTAKDAKEGD